MRITQYINILASCMSWLWVFFFHWKFHLQGSSSLQPSLCFHGSFFSDSSFIKVRQNFWHCEHAFLGILFIVKGSKWRRLWETSRDKKESWNFSPRNTHFLKFEQNKFKGKEVLAGQGLKSKFDGIVVGEELFFWPFRQNKGNKRIDWWKFYCQ